MGDILRTGEIIRYSDNCEGILMRYCGDFLVHFRDILRFRGYIWMYHGSILMKYCGILVRYSGSILRYCGGFLMMYHGSILMRYCGNILKYFRCIEVQWMYSYVL